MGQLVQLLLCKLVLRDAHGCKLEHPWAVLLSGSTTAPKTSVQGGAGGQERQNSNISWQYLQSLLVLELTSGFHSYCFFSGKNVMIERSCRYDTGLIALGGPKVQLLTLL